MMVNSFICLKKLRKPQHQIFVYTIHSLQDDYYLLIGGNVINHHVHRFHIVHHDRSFSVNQMQIRLYVRFLHGIFY